MHIIKSRFTELGSVRVNIPMVQTLTNSVNLGIGIDRNGLISDIQYGSHALWSTCDLLTVYREHIYECLDVDGKSRVISPRHIKAFS